MAATKAAGTADGSTQHTPKPADAETPESILSTISPEMMVKLLDLWKAREEGGRDERETSRRANVALSSNTRDLSPAQLTALKRLREPFPAEAIAKRPQPWCKACNQAPSRVCGQHKKITCKTCGQWITEAHNDLDYVGHAEITDRLLEVDPTWDWEPVSVDSRGLPAFDEHGGLWIRLTVCGLTRLGYGDAVGKKPGPHAVKEAIGDAFRNGGMRFGMALDLWAKTDLHREAEPEPNPADPFVERLGDGRVWNSEQWLAGLRREADEAGVLDYQPEMGGGATLGEIIDNRLAVLADAARLYAEARIKRDEEKAAAAAQVAAEHGVSQQQSAPPTGTATGQQRPPATQSAAQPAPPAGPPPVEEGPRTAQEVRDACGGQTWLDPDALQSLLSHAQKIRAADAPANPNKPRGVTLGQALRTQINELRRAAANRAGTGQAAHAANEYADPYGYGDESYDAAG
jgi:hypothetical protein